MTDTNLPPTEPIDAQFSARLRGPDFLRIGVVFGALVILLVAAAVASGSTPRSAAPGAANANQLSAQTTNGTATIVTTDGWQRVATSSDTTGQGSGGSSWLGGMPGFASGPQGMPDMPGMMGGHGFGRGVRGPFGGMLGGITITAIDGSNISLKTGDGWTRTITATNSTTITKGGQTISLSDLKVGDSIFFTQTRNSDGSWTIDTITVVLPHVVGTVATVTDSGFTVTARDGSTWTVTVSSATTYSIGLGSGSMADVTTGATVEVEGTTGSGNTMAATAVRIQPAFVAGQVIAVSGSTITIKALSGASDTIHVTSATTYRVAGKTNASLSDITVGTMVIAQGTKRADGSLDASIVASGGQLRGFGGLFGGGRFGKPFEGGPFGPNGGTSPSASPTGQGTNG